MCFRMFLMDLLHRAQFLVIATEIKVKIRLQLSGKNNSRDNESAVLYAQILSSVEIRGINITEKVNT